jgi:hypothetical protein
MKPALLRYMHAHPADIIEAMLRVLFPDARGVVDFTPGNFRFWGGEDTVRPYRVYFPPKDHDFRTSRYTDAGFDVVVFDPPHVADGGKNGIMAKRFGTYKADELKDVIQAGCREAMRVARLGAIVKVTDHVHAQVFYDQTGWVREVLGTPYDVVHQVREGNLEDGKWRGVYSARSNGATYLAYRHGDQKHRERTPK